VLEYGGRLWLYSVSFRWLTLGHKRALQVPKSPIRLCLLHGKSGRHLPCVVAAAIVAVRPSAPEAWPPNSSSSLVGASAGAVRPCLVSLLQISHHRTIH